jgi:hypothetical protein
LAQHVVFHERQDVGEMLVFIVMGVDVDDHRVVELALMRLAGRMRQQLAGIEILDDAPVAIGNKFHERPMS